MTTKDYQTRSPLRIFLSYFKPHRRLFALDLSCAFLIACIDLAFPLVSRAAMYTWLPQRQFRVFFIVMAVVVAAYVLRSALYFVVAYWGHTFGIRVEAEYPPPICTATFRSWASTSTTATAPAN